MGIQKAAARRSGAAAGGWPGASESQHEPLDQSQKEHDSTRESPERTTVTVEVAVGLAPIALLPAREPATALAPDHGFVLKPDGSSF